MSLLVTSAIVVLFEAKADVYNHVLMTNSEIMVRGTNRYCPWHSDLAAFHCISENDHKRKSRNKHSSAFSTCWLLPFWGWLSQVLQGLRYLETVSISIPCTSVLKLYINYRKGVVNGYSSACSTYYYFLQRYFARPIECFKVTKPELQTSVSDMVHTEENAMQ